MTQPHPESFYRSLWEASRELDPLLSVDELMPVLNRLIARTLDCECASLLVVDPEVGALRPWLAVGQHSDEIRAIIWDPGRGVAGRVLSSNQPEAVEDATADPDADFETEARLGVRVRSLLAVPLERNGEPVGVIEAINKRGGPFTGPDMEFFRLLAQDIASAVDNARIFQLERRERSENEILYRLATRVSRSLGLRQVLEDILDSLAVLVSYDAAAIYLMQADGSGSLSQIAMRGYDAEREGSVRIKMGQGIVGWVCQSGRGVIVPDAKRDPRYVEAKESSRSEIATPVVSGSRVVGAFNLESDRLGAFEERDLRLLEAFAGHAAVALERAQLYENLEQKERLERELTIARNIQNSFQPRSNPTLPGFDIAGLNESSEEVSGDYYDFLHIHQGHLGITLADVSGKGIPAALIMASFRASLIAEIRNNYAIKTILSKVNRLLVESSEPGRFVTAFYGVLDLQPRKLTWANAGHNPPILLRASGKKVEELAASGTILGVFPDATFRERTLEFHPGDVLLLYTDGLTEAMSPEGEEYGTLRVEGRLRTLRDRPAPEICRGLLSGVREFVGQSQLKDDVTLVVIRALDVPVEADSQPV